MITMFMKWCSIGTVHSASVVFISLAGSTAPNLQVKEMLDMLLLWPGIA